MTTIGEKANYVRQRLRNREAHHTCHWPGCTRFVPPSAWGCTRHWYMLPQSIRSKIWRAFRPGQEETKTPDRRYLEAAREAQNWIKDHLAKQGATNGE